MKINQFLHGKTFLIALTLACGRALPAAECFVAPDGSDQNSGTRENPFATLAHARDFFRETKSGETKILWLDGGNYPLLQTLELTSADSGLTIRSVENNNVILSGGRSLTATDFHAVADATTLARIAPAMRGKILELDLTALGVRHCQAYPDIFNDSGNLVELYYNGRRMPLSRFPERRLHDDEARAEQRRRRD